jgi:flavocytochrome c
MIQYDVIIIGAGSAGIPCAIRAAERGLQVLVIEKDTEPGGTLHVTAGHLSAGGTKRQKDLGIDDNTDNHWKDVQRISNNTADEVIAKKAIELAPAAIDWLQELGYCFHEKSPVTIYGHEAYGQPRTYFGAGDYFGGPIMQPGKAVLQTLLPVFEKLVEKGNITLLCNHSLQKITVDNCRVAAIEVLNNEQIKLFKGKSIVLTTGGYAANKTFFEEQHPGLRLISTAKETSTGDGIKAALEAGCIFHNADKHISTLGGVETEPGSGRASFWNAWARVSNSHDRKPREIYVNERGERFMNEFDLTVDERERIVLQQPGKRFYVVFDEAALQDGPCVVVQWDAEKLKEEAAKEKCCWAAGSIEELAEKINVPAETLAATVHTFNQFAASQKDTGFGRTYLQHNLTQAPYYALLVYAYALISFGGIKVNEQLQVVHRDGAVIENLYAAGEILGAGTTSGNAFCGGMLLTPAISFGKWLGENI